MLTNVNQLGRNLLHRSCMQGNFKIVEVILEFMKQLDLNLDCKDKRQYTAANLAMIRGYPMTNLWKQGMNYEQLSALELDGG